MKRGDRQWTTDQVPDDDRVVRFILEGLLVNPGVSDDVESKHSKHHGRYETLYEGTNQRFVLPKAQLAHSAMYTTLPTP